MPPPPLNLNWVTPSLAVGGRFDVAACRHLARALHIGAIVDVRAEDHDDPDALRREGIEWLHLPTVDHQPPEQTLLDGGVRWVNARLDAGRKVFIHCEHGVGRSALVALCVMVSRGFTPVEALRTAKAARWQVSPSPAQLEAYLHWCAPRVRDLLDLTTFDELARIAYAHVNDDSAAHS